MANIHIKSDERKASEAYVLDSFGRKGEINPADRDAAEIIAARSREAYNEMKRMEVKVTITHNGKHPYHHVSEDGKGVYGWVDSANVSK